MTEQPVGIIRRSWRLFWRLVTGFRRFLANIIFLALIALLWMGLMVQDGEPIAPGSVLLLAPMGEIVEQSSLVDPLVSFVDPQLLESETVLHDLIAAVDAARVDDRIKAMVIDLNALSTIDISSARELGIVVQQFKESGKPVVAMADSYNQQSYLLASFADEIYLHSMGMVGIRGFGVYPTYYKDILERLKIDVHVFRVGEYKAAVEPFIRDDMSPQAKLNNLRWLESLWGEYLAMIAANRDLEPDAVEDYVNQFDQVLLQADGDAARAALDRGFIDQVMSREDMNQRLRERIDGDLDELMVHFYDYLDDVSGASDGDEQDSAVAVVVAEGMIVDGRQPPGLAGGDTIAAQLRDARDEDRIKAVVLRVNSEGGSAFASEVIREQVQLLQQAGKPVVASMGGIAASGGYWIAAGADEIWAQPTTITGSIGIFGVFPSFYRGLSHWGIHSDGVGTTRLADGSRADRPLNNVARNSLQLMIEEGYRRFINLVADARGINVDAVDRIAQGQVWSGQAAQQQGLVDHLGGVDDAIAAAAALANLADYDTLWTDDERWLDASLLQRIWGVTASAVGERMTAAMRATLPFEAMLQPVANLPQLNDPAGVYLHCMECVRM
jgi:protease-4